MPVKIGLDAPMTELFAASPDGILVVDRNHRICDANPACTRLFNLGEQKLVGLPVDALPGEPVANNCYAEPLIYIDMGDQTERWLQCITRPVEHLPSTVAELRFYRDVTDAVTLRHKNTTLSAQLENAHGNDPVTGALNANAMWQALNTEVARSRRYQNPLSIMLIRVAPDSISNESLQALGGLLRDQLRWADIVARSGDGEFTVILPETSLSSARGLAIKLAPMMGSTTLNHNHGMTNIEMPQIGIAQWQPGDDSNQLIQRAAESMVQSLGDRATRAIG